MGFALTPGPGVKLYRRPKALHAFPQKDPAAHMGCRTHRIADPGGGYFFTSKTLASMVGFTSILAMTSGAGRPLFSSDMGTTMPKGSFW